MPRTGGDTPKELSTSSGCAVAARGSDMGALCSSEQPPVHVCRFPMYVVKVSDFLQMEGPPEPHDVLMEKNMLHQREPGKGMFVLFISHQWLGSEHPDPSGQQLAVLRSALRRIIDGQLPVEEDMTLSCDW
eukprot:Skav216639  [mRNA]  locus=scaffold1255:161364:164616:+ [translate_table: standard]